MMPRFPTQCFFHQFPLVIGKEVVMAKALVMFLQYKSTCLVDKYIWSFRDSLFFVTSKDMTSSCKRDDSVLQSSSYESRKKEKKRFFSSRSQCDVIQILPLAEEEGWPYFFPYFLS